MPCELCQKREAEEREALADCKQQTEQLSLKAQRLALSVAVLGTLAGREALDYALGISNNITKLSVVDEDEGGSFAQAQTADVVVEELDSVVFRHPVSELENFDNFGSGVDGYLWSLPPLLPSAHDSIIQSVKYQDAVVRDIFVTQNAPLSVWSIEPYITIPGSSSLSVLGASFFLGHTSRKRY